MKVSQLVFGSVLVFFSALGLYAGLTTHPNGWGDWFGIGSSLVALCLVVIYLQTDLKGKKKKTLLQKDNTLNIDVEAKDLFRAIIAFAIIGLDILFLYKFHSGPAILVFLLVFLGAYWYGTKPIAPGIYKNGKYLGTIYTGFIKAEDSLTVGERQDTEEIGVLKVIKNGKEVVKLALTTEGFVELKPDKIWEVFPEIKGNIERFGNLFKVGDYTLEYSLFQNNTSYEYAYENTHKLFDRDILTDPVYSSLPGNIYHHD